LVSIFIAPSFTYKNEAVFVSFIEYDAVIEQAQQTTDAAEK